MVENVCDFCIIFILFLPYHLATISHPMFSSYLDWTFAWSVYIRIRNILVYLVHVGDVDVELWIPNFLNQVGVSK